MTNTSSPSRPLDSPVLSLSPARTVAQGAAPWVPLSEGKSFKPLRFLRGDRGYVALLRLEPGTAILPHRHAGEIHALNLEGSRQLCTGELIGPGDYVYEPPGNTDHWKAVGAVPVVVLIVVTGAVEYLGPDGSVTSRVSAETQRATYHRHCVTHGIEPLDLDD